MTDLGIVARVLAETALAMDSVEDAPMRLRRVLDLVLELVPARRAAMLCAGPKAELLAVPELPEDELRQLEEELTTSLQVMDGARERADGGGARPPHLDVPITALDRVLGILHVDAPAGRIYDVDHVRVLSVVAAQVGAFLNTLRFVAEEERRARTLAEAHELQSLVSSIVTHDLRSPIMVVTTGAEVLRQRLDDPQLMRILERITSSARRADRIISDLFLVTQARVDGVLPLAPRQANLVELVRQVVDDARLAHARREVRLECPDLVVGCWDPDRLAQVFTNLVNNAVEHGSRNDPITLCVSVDDQRAVVTVHNEGPPIPANARATLFDPLKRQRHRSHGLGLGLFIVSEIVRAHGGRVDVDSGPHGTTFAVLLPLDVASPAVEARDEPAVCKQAPLVLVVDDYADVRTLVCELLVTAGFRTAEAKDGGEAVELASLLRPDLVIMDIAMPVLDGIQATERLRAAETTSHIPVLAYSSSPPPLVQRALAAGCVAAIPKSDDVRVLLREVTRLVS